MIRRFQTLAPGGAGEKGGGWGGGGGLGKGPLYLCAIQLKSGQARSECLTCTFRASCCSARLSWAQIPAFAVPLSGTGNKRGEGVKGGGGDRLHWRVQRSTSSPDRNR